MRRCSRCSLCWGWASRLRIRATRASLPPCRRSIADERMRLSTRERSWDRRRRVCGRNGAGALGLADAVRVFGLGALVWMLPWYFAMPRGGPKCEGRAQAASAASGATGSTGATAAISITKMLRLRCAWGTTIGHFCGNYFYYFLLAWLPTYLVQEEHLSIRSMSRLTAAISLLIACSTLVCGLDLRPADCARRVAHVGAAKLVVGRTGYGVEPASASRWFTDIR